MLKNQRTIRNQSQKSTLTRRILPVAVHVPSKQQFSNENQSIENRMGNSQENHKIVKISDLINKNICAKKEISLNNNTVIRSGRKQKLEVSLSKEKKERDRSISEKSQIVTEKPLITDKTVNKSMSKIKLKLSLHREKSVRKIKCFELNNQEKEIKHIKTPRVIRNLLQDKQAQQMGPVITSYNSIQPEKKKIVIHRHV